MDTIKIDKKNTKTVAHRGLSGLELMNTCGVICWDGFHGKHPKNVKDGIMFDFRATVNDGQEIHADGSENFPKGYHDFVRELNKILTDHEDN